MILLGYCCLGRRHVMITMTHQPDRYRPRYSSISMASHRTPERREGGPGGGKGIYPSFLTRRMPFPRKMQVCPVSGFVFCGGVFLLFVFCLVLLFGFFDMSLGVENGCW